MGTNVDGREQMVQKSLPQTGEIERPGHTVVKEAARGILRLTKELSSWGTLTHALYASFIRGATFSVSQGIPILAWSFPLASRLLPRLWTNCSRVNHPLSLSFPLKRVSLLALAPGSRFYSYPSKNP